MQKVDHKFSSEIEKKLAKVNNHLMGENLSNQVTLVLADIIFAIVGQL
jgi:hypothetical protein